MYVEKNIEFNQEFFFAHPTTKLAVNKIYNSHYTSSPLWNLFGDGAKKIESSYNRSVKIMLDLPYATHRCLIEPLSGEKHVKKVLISRYLGFMEKISTSNKKAIQMLVETSKNDVRSVTGRNFRNIMLLVGKTSVDEVTRDDADKIEYFPIDDTEKWKITAIKEIIEVKNKAVAIENMKLEEIEEILTYLCTS